MPSGSDHVIRRPEISICDRWRLLNHSDDVHFRRYRGKIPREGYIKDEVNPFSRVKDRNSPTPLRGC